MSSHNNPAPVQPAKGDYSSEFLLGRLKKINQQKCQSSLNALELELDVQYIAHQIKRFEVEEDKDWGPFIQLTLLSDNGKYYIYLPKEYTKVFLDEDIVAINEGKIFVGVTYKQTGGKKNKRYFSVDVINKYLNFS